MVSISRCCLVLLCAGLMSAGVSFAQAAPKHLVETVDSPEIISQQKLLADVWYPWLSELDSFVHLKHYRTKMEKEYFAAIRTSVQTSISIIKGRPYFEKRILKASYKDWTCPSGPTRFWVNCPAKKMVGYYTVSMGIAAYSPESYAEYGKAELMKEFYWLQGRDPVEYCETIAATVRPKPILPPFRIGKITVEDKDRNYRWTDAGRDLVDARRGLEFALKDLKEKQAKFKEEELKYWQAYEDLQVRLRPLRRAYEAAIAPALKAEKARATDLRRRADSEAQKDRKQIEELDKDLALLRTNFFTGPKGPQYTAEARKRMRAERAKLQEKLKAISAQVKPKQTEPQLRAASQDAKELYERWQSEKRLSDLKMAQVGRDLDDAARYRDHDEDDVTKAEAALDKATEAWNAAQRNQTVRLAQISSDDFRARFISGLPDIGKLNRLIDHARFNLRVAESAHAARRQDLVKWGDVLTHDSETLATRGYASALGQAGVEAADQLKDFFADLEEEGPPAALAGAAVNIFWNIATPPTIYDAETGPLPHSLKDIAAFAKGEGEGMAKTAINKARSSLRATIAHTREVTIPQLLAEQTARIEAGDFSGLSAVESALSRQQAQLERIQKDFAAKVLKRGAATFVKKIGGQVLGSLGKSIIKAEIKKGIAEFVEGPALYKYAEDQMELMLAGRRLAMARTVADQLRGQLAQLQKQRDALLDKHARYDASAGSLVEKNRQFIAKAGYAFYLYPKERGKAAGKSDASGQLKVRVFLQGIELKQERSPGDIKFVIRPEDEAKFNTPKLPEKLALSIKLQ